MSNDIINLEDMDFDPWEELVQEFSNQRIVGDLLKFTKSGSWEAGKDEVEVPLGTQLVAYVSGLHDGWVYWSDGRPTKFDLGLVGHNHPKFGAKRFRLKTREELGDFEEADWPERDGEQRDPWQRTFYLILVDPRNGDLYTYAPSSFGGRQAIGDLVKAWRAHNKTNGSNDQPIVALDGSSYKHREKALGEIQIPILKVEGFTSELPQSLIDTGVVAVAEPPEFASPPQEAIGPPQANGGQPAATKTLPAKPAAAKAPPAKPAAKGGKSRRL